MSDQTSTSPCTDTSRSYTPIFVIVAAVQVGGALLLTLARMKGMIEAETATRGAMVLIGFGLAAFGNLMPKMLEGPPRTVSEATVAQSVLRFGGWAMTIAGLLWSALWAFAPRDIANTGGVAAVVISMGAMASYSARKYRAMRGSGER